MRSAPRLAPIARRESAVGRAAGSIPADTDSGDWDVGWMVGWLASAMSLSRRQLSSTTYDSQIHKRAMKFIA
ncbi:hypothetical protein NECAME_06320 [Necator americanus]|uniref:Uncharacterized protein n=1 Tax=Necator americanus TaxID=51031 RepID=W2TX65_NECAM|nr:hypothetical protein NECAME_06320 [Necator americanus]ETN85617.1 hypothetical protein NECAME_06320 [Necator americanus]